MTMMLGLGGTTPVGKWLLGRAFEILTFERFTFWATLMALPFVGILAQVLIERYSRKAVVALWVAAVATFGSAISWNVFHPIYFFAVQDRPGGRLPEPRRTFQVPLHDAGFRRASSLRFDAR